MLSRRRCGSGPRQTGLDRLRFGHPSLAEAGDGHPTDRRWQAVPGAGRGTAQQQRHQPGVHEAAMGQDGRLQTQHRFGGRFLGPDRTPGGQIRLQRAGWSDPRRAQSQPASRAPMVRNLEERPVQLPARLGEEGLRPLPARPDGRRQHTLARLRRATHTGHGELEHRTAQPPRRCHPGRRCARLCGHDAAHQGGGRPRAHGHHDPGGERSGNPGRHARPLALGQ